MVRGTTPTLTFTLPFNTSIIKSVYVTFSQKDQEVFTVETNNCTLSDNQLIIELTQSQTLAFTQNAVVEIQLRVLTNEDDALASNIIRTSVEKILRDGEI